MVNNVSLKKFEDLTSKAMRVSMEYMQEKVNATRAADENAKTQTASEKEANQAQRS